MYVSGQLNSNNQYRRCNNPRHGRLAHKKSLVFVFFCFDSFVMFFSQSPAAAPSLRPPPLSEPPQIYLTSVGDPASLTTLLPVPPVRGPGSPSPPPHISAGIVRSQKDVCSTVSSSSSLTNVPESASHPSHQPQVFLIINHPSSQHQQQQQQQQQQVAVTSAVTSPPAVAPSISVRPSIVIKEEMNSEQEMLEMVSLEEKRVDEVETFECTSVDLFFFKLDRTHWGTCCSLSFFFLRFLS